MRAKRASLPSWAKAMRCRGSWLRARRPCLNRTASHMAVEATIHDIGENDVDVMASVAMAVRRTSRKVKNISDNLI